MVRVSPIGETSNACLGSTTWEWRKVKLKSPPGGEGLAKRVRSRSYPAASRNRNRPLWLEIAYRGGAESFWLVRTRGCSWRFPGYAALEDVMAWANQDR